MWILGGIKLFLRNSTGRGKTLGNKCWFPPDFISSQVPFPCRFCLVSSCWNKPELWVQIYAGGSLRDPSTLYFWLFIAFSYLLSFSYYESNQGPLQRKGPHSCWYWDGEEYISPEILLTLAWPQSQERERALKRVQFSWGKVSFNRVTEMVKIHSGFFSKHTLYFQ